MQLFIKTKSGKTIVIEVEADESIDCQYMIFERKPVQNNKILKNYGIYDQFTIKQCLKTVIQPKIYIVGGKLMKEDLNAPDNGKATT